MARTLLSYETFDTLLDEVYFTGGRLDDEPLARGLVARLDAWEAWILETEALFRKVKREATWVRAARVGANHALDERVKRFGKELAHEADGDTGRWRGFFRTSVTEFIRQPLDTQMRAVAGWLTEPDPVVERFRETLKATVDRVDRALGREGALAKRRGTVWTAREELAGRLNAARRELEAELEAIARTHKLPKTWVASFFATRSGGSDDGAPATTTTPAPE